MKIWQIVALSAVVFLEATTALAQHGHGGGAAGSMGRPMGAGSMQASDHGNSNKTATSQQAKVSSILEKNPAIRSKIVALTGDKLGAADACTSFKNLGQCVAAAHVSKNLGMNFYCLRQAMTGTPAGTSAPSGGCTTTGHMSLGKAIQTLDPKADSNTESKKASHEAEQDLKSPELKS
jgi:hypothetical protein